jgi:hypothetical protein
MRDEAFLTEARALGMDLYSVDDKKVQAIVDATINASPDAIARAKAVLQVDGGKAD